MQTTPSSSASPSTIVDLSTNLQRLEHRVLAEALKPVMVSAPWPINSGYTDGGALYGTRLHKALCTRLRKRGANLTKLEVERVLDWVLYVLVTERFDLAKMLQDVAAGVPAISARAAVHFHVHACWKVLEASEDWLLDFTADIAQARAGVLKTGGAQ